MAKCQTVKRILNGNLLMKDLEGQKKKNFANFC